MAMAQRSAAQHCCVARRVALPDLSRNQQSGRRLAEMRRASASQAQPLAMAAGSLSSSLSLFFPIYSLSLSMPRPASWVLPLPLVSHLTLTLACCVPPHGHGTPSLPWPGIAPPYLFRFLPFVFQNFDQYIFQVIPCFTRMSYLVSREYFSW